MLDLISPLWEAATAVYEAAKEVKENYEECTAIQRTVQSLVKTIKTCATITATLREHIKELTSTLQDLTKILKILAAHSMFYRIMHRKSIKCRLQDTRKELETATSLFQVGTQTELLNALSEVNVNVQRIAEAHRSDEHATEARYVELLKSSEVEMFQTLGVEERQMSDAMLALTKHMQNIPEGLEKRCCERGLDAMRRRTGEVIMDTDEFTLSSFEVSIRKNEKLGAGGFASVYRGTYRDGMAVAVKVLTEGAPASALRQEVDVWKSLSHPNILQFIGVCSTADPPFMVCAYKKNGNALDYLRKKPTVSRHKLLYEASQGLVYLHDKKIIHGDIKATNILIDADGTACLADFGLSRVKLQTTVALNLDPTPQKGTVRWMAPEQLGGSSASRKTDIYSFAMTIYETFTGRPPFPEHNDSLVFMMVHDKGIRPKFDDVKPEIRALGLEISTWALVEHCWKQDPKERWSALELSEALHKVRNAQLAPPVPARPTASIHTNSPGLGAQGRSVSDYASYPPPGSRFLQEPDFPRPRYEPQPQSAPAVPRQKDLPPASPSNAASHRPVLSPSPPPSYESAVRTVVPSTKPAPVDRFARPPLSLPPSSTPLIQRRKIQAAASKSNSATPNAAHMDRSPQPVHSNTTPAASDKDSSSPWSEPFTPAATAALGRKTIPRPLSPEPLISFDDPVFANPGMTSPLHIEPFHGQPEPRQFSPQSTKTVTSTTLEGLIFKGTAVDSTPVTHSDEVPLLRSRHHAFSAGSPEGLAPQRGQTEPIRSKPLPPDRSPPATPHYTLTSYESNPPDSSPFEEEDSYAPSTGAPSVAPSRSPSPSTLDASDLEPLQPNQPTTDPFADLHSHFRKPAARAVQSRAAPPAQQPPSEASTKHPNDIYPKFDEEDLSMRLRVMEFPPPAGKPTVRGRKE